MIDPFLEEGLLKLGLSGGNEDRISSLLGRYIEEIELFNPAYGLVKVRDRRELLAKHIFDSLAPLNIMRGCLESGAGLQENPAVLRVADVGSGAGLPGIPLAICMSDVEFTLIERMGRRAGFLRDAIAVLSLSNVKVEEAEMEKLSAFPENRFNLIVFRAFKPLTPDILGGLFRLLAPDGILAAYKGRRQSLDEEMDQLLAHKKDPSPSVEDREIYPLEVPFLKEERHLLLIRKRP
jgi:16S rRNA (guanine527-N7)-methyltransferase